MSDHPLIGPQMRALLRIARGRTAFDTDLISYDDGATTAKAWCNARHRLSRLLRVAARARALGGGSDSFCRMEDAVAALVSAAKSSAISIPSANGPRKAPTEPDLFDVFYFDVDVSGDAELDRSRRAQLRRELDDVQNASEDVGDDEAVLPFVTVSVIIERILKLQMHFECGGESLRRDELDMLIMQVHNHLMVECLRVSDVFSSLFLVPR